MVQFFNQINFDKLMTQYNTIIHLIYRILEISFNMINEKL